MAVVEVAVAGTRDGIGLPEAASHPDPTSPDPEPSSPVVLAPRPTIRGLPSAVALAALGRRASDGCGSHGHAFTAHGTRGEDATHVGVHEVPYPDLPGEGGIAKWTNRHLRQLYRDNCCSHAHVEFI